MNSKIQKCVLVASAFTLAAGLSLQAGAAETVDETVVKSQSVPSQTVTFHASELATPDGRRAVEKRIERVAEQVCGGLDYRALGSLSRLADNRECFDRAYGQAMRQIDSQVATID